MAIPRALVRPVSRSLSSCELSFRDREPIDLEKAAAQHRAYAAALEAAGLAVEWLPELPDSPDAVFVEDPIVVLDEIAIVGRPGAASREGEVESVAEAIGRYRPLVQLPLEARLEGGDVMRVGKTLYVGRSARTNAAAHEALAEMLRPFGYTVVPVGLIDCLHLKTGVTYAGNDCFLANPAWVEISALSGAEVVPLPPEEPWAANTLTIGDRVLLPAGFPHTLDLLTARGFDVQTIDVSELQKAEGSLTCLSVPFIG
ncbi:MAG TPA: arginine deiminase-related protein [Thermoanaerobaculia bacterium]|jgi:dimethylargininase|nr:arginine deiminase-related protein [Thermoanaerobaculia bacterium]